MDITCSANKKAHPHRNNFRNKQITSVKPKNPMHGTQSRKIDATQLNDRNDKLQEALVLLNKGQMDEAVLLANSSIQNAVIPNKPRRSQVKKTAEEAKQNPLPGIKKQNTWSTSKTDTHNSIGKAL